MDFEDVSRFENYMQLLRKQQFKMRDASKRTGEQPRDRKTRGQLLHEHMLQLTTPLPSDINGMFRQSWVSPPYPPSMAPFDSLRPLFIGDLGLEIHHRGFYIVLRIATPPATLTAVTAIVEDEKNDATILHLYHQGVQGFQPEGQAVRPQRVVILKEPYFNVLIDGGYGLRVDHPSDVVWLASDDQRVPSQWQAGVQKFDNNAENLKEQGNLAWKCGKVADALACYTSALRLSDTSNLSKALKLNRALVNLKLQRFDESIEDARAVTTGGQKSEKGLFRMGLALYGLGRFSESNHTFSSLIAEYPDNRQAETELTRTRQRLSEQDHGEYDFKAMYEAAKEKQPCLDNATFATNVEIRPSPYGGQGMFTTKDVTAGELLLCEKAFSYSHPMKSGISVSMNVDANRMVTRPQADLTTATVQTIFQNPSLGPQFTSLYHKDFDGVTTAEVDGMPVIDSFLVNQIITLNAFGCPRTSLEFHFTRPGDTDADETKSQHTSGVFIKASYINHSCYSNVQRSFIGDMMIVRAARDIPANSELLFWYVRPEPEYSYEQTQKRLLRTWGFQCSCRTCEESKKTKKNVRTRRNNLLKDFEAATQKPLILDSDIPRLERIVEAIDKTYSTPAHEVPRLALLLPLTVLAQIYYDHGRREKVVETAWKTLVSQGFVIKREGEGATSFFSPFEIEQWGPGMHADMLMQTWIGLWTAYAELAPNLCAQVEKYARITYRIGVGEDETFDETYGKLVREAILGGRGLGEGFNALRASIFRKCAVK